MQFQIILQNKGKNHASWVEWWRQSDNNFPFDRIKHLSKIDALSASLKGSPSKVIPFHQQEWYYHRCVNL